MVTISRRPDGTVEVRTEAGIWAIDPEIAEAIVADALAEAQERVFAVIADHYGPGVVAHLRTHRATQGGTPAEEDADKHESPAT